MNIPDWSVIMDKKEFLRKLEILRKQRKWSKSRLNDEAGLPTGTIYQWDKSVELPTIKSIESICRAFHITLSQFFMDPDKLEEEFLDKEIYNQIMELRDSEKRFILNVIENLKELRN